MASSSSVKNKKRHSSQSPTESQDEADGAVPSATVSDELHIYPGTASARSFRPESFPRCQYCFLAQRTCDGRRPCDTCSIRYTACLNVTQQDIDWDPARALSLMQKYGLVNTAAPNNEPIPKNKKDEELMHCSRVFKELLSDKYADCNVHFLEPEDHEELKLPHYLNKSKYPMYLSTIKEALEAGEYNSVTRFTNDFLRVVSLARWLNEEGSEVHEAAQRLEQAFNTIWRETKQSKKKAKKTAIVENEGQPETKRSKRKSDKTAVVENEDQQETKRSKKGQK